MSVFVSVDAEGDHTLEVTSIHTAASLGPARPWYALYGVFLPRVLVAHPLNWSERNFNVPLTQAPSLRGAWV